MDQHPSPKALHLRRAMAGTARGRRQGMESALLPGGGRAETKLHPILGHSAAGDVDALLLQQLRQLLIAEGALAILLPDQFQQPQLHGLLGGALFPQGPAEEIAEGIRPLAALEVFLPSGPGDGGGGGK